MGPSPCTWSTAARRRVAGRRPAGRRPHRGSSAHPAPASIFWECGLHAPRRAVLARQAPLRGERRALVDRLHAGDARPTRRSSVCTRRSQPQPPDVPRHRLRALIRTEEEPRMAMSYASTVIDAPADEVWAHIRDFNGLATWHSGLVTTSEIEDGKTGDQVGAVRSFTLADGAHLRERCSATPTPSARTPTTSRRRRSTSTTTSATLRVSRSPTATGASWSGGRTSTAIATSRSTGPASSPARCSRAASRRSRRTSPGMSRPP